MDQVSGRTAPLSSTLRTGRRGFLGLLGGGSLLAVGACTATPAGVAGGPGAGEVGPASGAAADHVTAVITVHPDATAAALGALDDGGTAADAALAAAAVLSVVEPYFSNLIAGETSALYRTPDGTVQSLSAAGHVGADYDPAAYRERGEAGYGLYQALVPGAWQGWIRLAGEHGRLPLERLLAPAIALARDGFPADAIMAGRVAGAAGIDAVNEPAAAIYLPDGEPIAEGATVVQTEYAATLQQLADAAAGAGDREAGLQAADDLVYRGALGERIVAAIREDGGYLTAADLDGFASTLGESVSLAWDDEITVHQNPPPSQGLTMLLALNTLRTADLSAGADDPAALHTQIEAVKLAMADREAWVGDPEAIELSVEDVLAPEYGERQLARISDTESLSWPIPDGLQRNTTTFQIVDGEGNAVTVTTSTGFQLTSVGDTGIMINNRMRFMTTEPGGPNELQPGRTVRYTGNPWLATKGDALWLVGGAIGADVQAQVQTQHLLGMVAFGQSVTETVEAPRYRSEHFPNSITPHDADNVLLIENTYPQAVMDGLRSRGQRLEVAEPSSDFGYATMIELAADGRSATAAEDPRTSTSTGEVRAP